MKKLIIFLLFAFSINANSQTTIEEWNYVTKGYQIQIASGLDMKKGYELKFINEYVYNDTDGSKKHFIFRELFKINEKRVSALMVEIYVIYKGKNLGTKYFCLPTKNSDYEIEKLLVIQSNRFTALNSAVAYTWALSKLLSDNYISIK